MPYINKVRLVNVRFNNNNSRFEDLKMPIDGKSTTYELINGGGKSVLLMMLLQVVLPNESLKTEKPVKNIFTNTKDISSHVLVEWILEEGGYHTRLLTGFCSRKSRDREGSQGMIDGGIDYFNYTYLYNESNPNDIYSLELFKEEDGMKKVMSYQELKSKLHKLKDSGKAVEIFENRKREYQEFLKGYQIVQAEWDILRKINVRENNLANYFREDKSSKKLIENFLVKIVDKVGENKDKVSEEKMANTLIKMKDMFAKLQREYRLLEEYEQYKFTLEKIIEAVNRAVEVFEDVDDFNKEVASIVYGINELLMENTEVLTRKKDQLEVERERLFDIKKGIKSIEVSKNQLLMNEKHVEDISKGTEIDDYKKRIADLEDEILYYQAVNQFFDYKDTFSKIKSKQEELYKIGLSDTELFDKRNYYGQQLKYALEDNRSVLDDKKNYADAEVEVVGNKINKCEKDISDLNKQFGSQEYEVNRLTQEIENDKLLFKECNTELLQTGEFNSIIYDADIQIEQMTKESKKVDTSINSTDEQIILLDKSVNDISVEITKINGEIELLDEKHETNNDKIQTYRLKKEQIDMISQNYDIHNVIELQEELRKISDEEYSRRSELEFAIKDIDKQLDVIKVHGIYVFNYKLIELHEHLKGKLSIILGSEYLKRLSQEDRKTCLKKYKFLPYSIMLPESEYNKVKKDASIIGKKFVDSMIPIVNWDSVKRNDLLDSEDVLFPMRDVEFHLSSLSNVEMFKDELIEKKRKKKIDFNEIENSINVYQNYLGQIKNYTVDYPESVVEELLSTEANLKKSIEILSAKLKGLRKNQESAVAKRQELLDDLEGLKSRSTKLKSVIEILLKFKKLNDGISENENKFKKAQSLLREASAKLQTRNDDKKVLINEQSTLRIQLNDLKTNIEKVNDELITLVEFHLPKTFIPDENTIETIRGHFKVYNDKFREEAGNISRIEDEIAVYSDTLSKITEEIVDLGFALELLKEENPVSRIPKDTVKEKKELSRISNKRLGELRDEKEKILIAYTKHETNVENSMGQYERIYGKFEVLEGADNLADIKLKDKELRGLKETYKSRCSDMEDEIAKLATDVDEYVRAHRDFSVFATSNSIDLDDYKKQEYKEVSFDECRSRYKDIQKKVTKAQNLFVSEKSKLIKESSKFTVRNFRDDIEKIDKPSSLNESQSILSSLNSYIQILMEKMGKVKVEIEHEKSFKDGFVQQCVSAGVWMYDQLVKLNTLSKIKIPDLDVKKPMVEIELKCFEEEVQKKRMENHINSLVERITEDNKSSLSKELSSKAFLSQVVDMNSAKVYLYKVEDIVRNSRRIRWENAVESDGQTHTLYFLFLASIITFIRSITPGCDGSTKKVLIVDNPFGSASAVYLWRIMFAMMKENNFQLISAGHNISKEILPFFEVNYLLSEDIMSNGTKKVVVHDFRGIVESERLASEEIDTEQLSLF